MEKIFTIWATISLGIGFESGKNFLEKHTTPRNGMRYVRHYIEHEAMFVLGSPDFRVATRKTEVDLTVVSINDLGFEESACIKDIYERALVLGLELCPSEVGPQIYEQKRSSGPCIVAMDPIIAAEYTASMYPWVFEIKFDRDDDRWLSGEKLYPHTVISRYTRLIFILPRKQH